MKTGDWTFRCLFRGASSMLFLKAGDCPYLKGNLYARDPMKTNVISCFWHNRLYSVNTCWRNKWMRYCTIIFPTKNYKLKIKWSTELGLVSCHLSQRFWAWCLTVLITSVWLRALQGLGPPLNCYLSGRLQSGLQLFLCWLSPCTQFALEKYTQ